MRVAGLSLRARAAAVAAALLAITGVGAVALAPPAVADGPTTFTSTAAISVPAAGSAVQIGPASPYPSTIAVSGMAGPVSDISIDLNGLRHTIVNDLDVMLASPTGTSMIVMSDIASTGTFVYATDANITIDDDDAAFPTSGLLETGTYAPTNRADSGADSFPAPAPAVGAGTALGATFAGIDPNGTWSLYVVDDTTGDLGEITNGWSLTITTSETQTATTITASATPNPISTDGPVTLTAAVATVGGQPGARTRISRSDST